MGQACIVCGSESWSFLAEPHPARSVRTDGVTKRYPLRKCQCKTCGLVYRSSTEDLALVYADEYALYSNRPGADVFNYQRHPMLASLIARAVEPLCPARVLEVGCGNGSTLSAIRDMWPHVETIGLEPSRRSAELARASGHIVIEGMVGLPMPAELVGLFDLIFSIQVIEHTADPVAFLVAQASRLAPGGVVVTVCPNGGVPHAELIYSDHLFSFTHDHLAAVGETAGLARWYGCEFILDEAHEYNQLLVGGRAKGGSKVNTTRIPLVPQEEVSRLEEDRNVYLRQWACLESNLVARVGGAVSILCFGTGGWAANLAGYAPAIWERVRACTVDAPASAYFLDKPVVDYQNLQNQASDAVIVAVNPGRQDVVSARLQRDGFNAIRWNDLIDR